MGSDGALHLDITVNNISIHAPHMGSDPAFHRLHRNETYFNPRSPHGERLSSFKTSPAGETFQSTLPTWGATASRANGMEQKNISIHAPHMGSDTINSLRQAFQLQFQSTLPTWGATYLSQNKIHNLSISIHAPHMGSDVPSVSTRAYKAHFNPRSPHGERRLAHMLRDM